MTEDEAKKFGIDDRDRKKYIRVESSKVNLAAANQDTVWFELVGVDLGNATDVYSHGDNVAAAKRWWPPDEMIGGVAAKLGRQILDLIDVGLPGGGRYSPHRNAHGESAATNAVMTVIPNYSRAKAWQVIETFWEEQRLYGAEYRDENQRKTKAGLFVRGGQVKAESGEPPEVF
jgi:hypothetical protein